jgi:hypothetical protein
LIEKDAVSFDLSSFSAAKSLAILELKTKEYSALNFPGKLLFHITTNEATLGEGGYIIVRFPGYYDN